MLDRFCSCLVSAVVLTACINETRRVGETAPDSEIDTGSDLDGTAENEVDSAPAEVGSDGGQTETIDTQLAEDTPQVLEDTPPVMEETLVVADSAEDLSADTTPETRIEDIGSQPCIGEGDCTGLKPECLAWACEIGVCVLVVRDGGGCDDGDRCTGQGVCVEGNCEPGPELTCTGATACGQPVCDSAAGCLLAPIVGGYCETDSPNNNPWGTCNGLFMAPPDTCGDDAMCAEASTPANTPLAKDLVTGDWFAVLSSAIPQSRGTTAGFVAFDTGGLWRGTLLTNGTPFAIDTVQKRGWCMDADLGLAFDLAINHFVGQVDPAGEAFGASGAVGNEVVVGIRPTGNVIDVDGAYAALLTTLDGDGQPQVWSGTMTFALGRLEDQASLQSTADSEPMWITNVGASVQTPVARFNRLPLVAETGLVAVPMVFRGAIGPRGDVVLMVRAAADDTTQFGMLMLVRLSDEGKRQFNGETGWVHALQDANFSGGAWQYRRSAGALLFGGGVLKNGRFGERPVAGGGVAFDDYGRYVMKLRTDFEEHAFSGYLMRTGGIGFFYEVEVPDEWDTLFDVPEASVGHLYGVLVHRTR